MPALISFQRDQVLDGNLNAIRNVTIDNCAITSSNRGIAFMVFDGGVVENVVLSNLTVECERFDWFWWGDGDPIHFNLIKRSEIDANIDKTKEPAVILSEKANHLRIVQKI